MRSESQATCCSYNFMWQKGLRPSNRTKNYNKVRNKSPNIFFTLWIYFCLTLISPFQNLYLSKACLSPLFLFSPLCQVFFTKLPWYCQWHPSHLHKPPAEQTLTITPHPGISLPCLKAKCPEKMQKEKRENQEVADVRLSLTGLSSAQFLSRQILFTFCQIRSLNKCLPI